MTELTQPGSSDASRLERADSPRTLGVILLSRIALNLQFRVVYPFLPAISRGLGVPLETATLLPAIRSLVSMGSPLYGWLIVAGVVLSCYLVSSHLSPVLSWLA